MSTAEPQQSDTASNNTYPGLPAGNPAQQQLSLFDDADLAALQHQDGSVVNPVEERAKMPIGWSDVALWSLHTKDLCRMRIDHGDGTIEHRLYSEVVKNVPSPHYRLVDGSAKRTQQLNQAERRRAEPIFVDVIQHCFPGPVLPTELHVRIVMVAITLWYEEWIRGYRKNHLDLRRGDISKRSGGPAKRYIEDQVPEALYAFSKLDVERTYIYEALPGIDQTKFSAPALRVIKSVEIEGLTYDEIRRRRDQARREGTLKRGGRAWTLRVYFEEDFVRSATEGWRLGLPYDRAVRNLPLARLLQYKGWKQTFFTLFDTWLETKEIIKTPWEHVWTSVMGGLDHARLDDNAYRRRRIHMTRSFLREWAKDEYIELPVPPSGIEGKDGVWLMHDPYIAFRPKQADADQARSEPQADASDQASTNDDDDQRISQYDELVHVPVNRGYWLYLRRGPNYMRGRPPQRREVWLPYLLAVGYDRSQANRLAQNHTFLENVQGMWHRLRDLLIAAEDQPQRMRGWRWFLRDDVAQEDLSYTIQTTCSSLLAAAAEGGSVPASGGDSDMGRQRQIVCKHAASSLRASLPAGTECYDFLLNYISDGQRAFDKEIQLLSQTFTDLRAQLIECSGRNAQDYTSLKAAYQDLSEELDQIHESALSAALGIVPAVLWTARLRDAVERQVGPIYKKAAEVEPTRLIDAINRAGVVFPFWKEAIRQLRYDRSDHEVSDWDERMARVLELRMLEAWVERQQLKLI